MMVRYFVGVAAILAIAGVASVQADSLAGKITADGLKDSADAVVYVEEVPGESSAPPGENAVMDQQNMVFVPRVLPVVVGATVDFLNSDSVAHNVFSPESCADEFDLGNWTRGEVRSKTFDKPCAATILCFVHPGMEAFVVVVPTPFFAKTDPAGSFRIDGIPPGTYTVTVWHPTLKAVSQEVMIAGATSLDVALKR